MPRLVINPGSPAAWEVQLKPGVNSLGRAQANDFLIADPSVSGTHCQIVVENAKTTLKDLGSTNGTYVNRAPIRDAVLQTGQTIHLGGVEMAFYGDGPPPIPGGVAQAVPAGAPRVTGAAPVARISGLPPAPRVASATPVARVAAPAGEAPPPMPVEAPPVAETTFITSNQPCKFHPKTPARYYCGHCQRYYCEFCVTARTVAGVQHKTCRQCAAEVSDLRQSRRLVRG